MPTTLELPIEETTVPEGTVEDAHRLGPGATVVLPTTGTPPPAPAMSVKDRLEAQYRQGLEDNLNAIKSKCKRVDFRNLLHATSFCTSAIREAFRILGVDRWGKYEAPFVGDKVLADRGVTAHMNRDPLAESWRHGTYIFKGNELVFFVSMVRKRLRGRIVRIGADRAPFYVVTNVPITFHHH